VFPEQYNWDMSKKRKAKNYDYDVCLSFAGEDREYVSKVAALLKENGIRVFYDEYEQVALWGKDLYQHLDDIYRNTAKHCVVFVSRYYAKRLWTNHERKSAQARAFGENYEYILPARFDKTPLPGLLPTIGYVELQGLSAKEFAELILEKVGIPHRPYYVPPVPDRLFKALHCKTKVRRSYAVEQAQALVEALQRMSEIEKKLVAFIFLHGCPTDLPENMHIDADYLRRVSGLPISQCVRELKSLSSVGFRTKLVTRKNHGANPLIQLSFDMRTVDYDGPDDTTGVVEAMIGCLREDYCRECATTAILEGDFSALSTTTMKPEKHSSNKKRSHKSRL
jgi:hypothetical protein